MSNRAPFLPEGRRLDCVTLGRANMDLYTERERSIEETPSFVKSVGGSPANIAAAMARLGMRVGMITRVADDPVGRFVARFLSKIGVDTSQIRYDDSGASTSVAFAETRSTGSRTVLYRNNAADLRLSPSDIDPEFIASSAMLLISGQALATTPSRDAAMVAVEYARQAGSAVVLDIDYRPYSWETPEVASAALLAVARRSQLVVGTREEFDALELILAPRGGTKSSSTAAYAGPTETPNTAAETGAKTETGPPANTGPTETANTAANADTDTARRLLEVGVELVIVKRGSEGSLAFTKTGDVVRGPSYPVDRAKPYGAGDAFAGALLYQITRGAPLEDALKAAAAAASINIARSRCAEDMATWKEIEAFLEERHDALSH